MTESDMTNDQEHVILSEIEQEGYDDALQYADISDNPYARGTKEFEAWRAGWACGKVFLSSKRGAK